MLLTGVLCLGAIVSYGQNEEPQNDNVDTPPVPEVLEREDAPRRKRQRTQICEEWNVEVGWANWFTGDFDIVGSNNQPYTLSNLGSLHFALSRNYAANFPGPFAADFGLSISAQNFAFQDPTTQVLVDNGELVFQGGNPTDGRPVRSNFSVTHINAYFVPMLDFGFKVGIGGYVGYRLTGANTQIDWQGKDDFTFDRTVGNFNTLPYRYGLRAQVGHRHCQLFMNYDLTELFYRGKGPQLRTFSFGVIL